MINKKHLYDASFYIDKCDTVHKIIVADNIFLATEVAYAITRENEKLQHCTNIAEMEEVYTLTPSTIPN